MTRSIFQSGFVWCVINNKWPGFREVFLDFEPEALMGLSPEQWEGFVRDNRIVRHATKINAVRHDLWFVHDTSIEHGGFGAFLDQ